ncbi:MULTISPECIES: NAD-dependent epimerase/dehydratase family protein [unclassified Janthinobacterium]|uniref:NAD-dependent epimerase/dehydratase family protein n=1 Tax=unclassified Janthinobacterium TaxID=2610881 RepID=UPI0018CBD7FF|nr:NAD-dependent epimerase/dehydratase family protein [Janthinobacterium sp. CG_23.4]
MNISITGASGFIGKLLLQQLAATPHALAILSRKQGGATPGIRCVQGDLLQENTALHVFADNSDVIVHCAGEIKDERLMQQLHVDGTRHLLNAVRASIRKHGKPVHWVQLSSVGAYGLDGAGAQTGRTISEASEELPVGVYEVTKTASDQLVRDFAGQEPLFSYTIVRPTIVIGASMPNQSFHAMARMIKRGVFFRIGRQPAMATYVHVDDVVRALLQCISDTRARGKVFIVANDCPLEQVVTSLAQAMRVAPPRWTLPEAPLRWLLKLTPSWIKLPLTTARVDALTRKTRYSSALIGSSLDFFPAESIPESIPQLIHDSAHRL